MRGMEAGWSAGSDPSEGRPLACPSQRCGVHRMLQKVSGNSALLKMLNKELIKTFILNNENPVAKERILHKDRKTVTQTWKKSACVEEEVEKTTLTLVR